MRLLHTVSLAAALACAISLAAAQPVPAPPPATTQPAPAAPTPAPAPPPPGPATWRAQDIATIARMKFPEGIPIDVVSTMPRAVAQPVLLAMLDDAGEEGAWPNVVGMLGVVGDAAAGRALMTFIERPERGPLSGDQARAKSGAVVGLGYLVQRTGDNAALDFLIGGVRASTWSGDRLKWSSSATPDQLQRARLFATLSIMGLGVSGHPRALAVVQSIATGAPPFGDVRTEVPGADRTASEAVSNNQIVRSGGLKVLYGVQDNPNLQNLSPTSVSVREPGRLRDVAPQSVTITTVPSSAEQRVAPPSDGRDSCPASAERPFCATLRRRGG